ncbi:hypothetical protein [Micromonospora sp.]|uniref:hypothetical protein n=1 Tax=Micromonospora sp. TaxID=1876 RepID=UPI003B3A44A3
MPDQVGHHVPAPTRGRDRAAARCRQWAAAADVPFSDRMDPDDAHRDVDALLTRPDDCVDRALPT